MLLFGNCANGSNAAFVRFCAASLIWYSCAIASVVASVGGRRLEPLSSLAPSVVALCLPLWRPSESVIFILSVHNTRTLTFHFLLFLLFLVLKDTVQKLFQVFLLHKSQFFFFFFKFSFLMLPSPSSRCLWPGAPQDQVRGEEGNLPRESLGWDCCVGFRGLHPSVKSFQSDRSDPAV